jgi:hypothetical protein
MHLSQPAIVRPISLELIHSQFAPETWCAMQEGRRSVSFSAALQRSLD